MIYIGSDHGGFALKEQIKEFLDEAKLPFEDLGPTILNPGDDYFDYAAPVAEKVAADPLDNLGIVICRSGQGVNIVANKFKGVRAALVWNVKEAKMSRTDDLVNILSLPADYISADVTKNIVKTWLSTPLGAEERHVRRVQKIKDLENNLYK
jgi:RpiB/LacA/LacB family sugar-phosphate isomerase